MERYDFFRHYGDGTRGELLGYAVRYELGWKFFPWGVGRRASRKYHATIARCLPRWVGYPDRCESRAQPADHR